MYTSNFSLYIRNSEIKSHQSCCKLRVSHCFSATSTRWVQAEAGRETGMLPKVPGDVSEGPWTILVITFCPPVFACIAFAKHQQQQGPRVAKPLSAFISAYSSMLTLVG